ncbi:hypothetical protein LL037_25470 (plasmid) [Clostridium estertheticum]|nr:hypothetical protein [Clostridium estertheticum]MBU3201781.1 hypothetical protein [Clostridium estertheticum]WAG68176.1 hypothetical protein LL037_25470 [Clostridium estertheticum]
MNWNVVVVGEVTSKGLLLGGLLSIVIIMCMISLPNIQSFIIKLRGRK